MAGDSHILKEIIKPQRGDLSAEHAKYILSLDFSPRQQARYAQLAAKARDGLLTKRESQLLDDFLNANSLLMVLQSKARMSLRKRPFAA